LTLLQVGVSVHDLQQSCRTSPRGSSWRFNLCLAGRP